MYNSLRLPSVTPEVANMENEEMLSNLKALRDALQVSPENVPLRTLYVENLLKLGNVDEAMGELKALVKSHPENSNFRYLLAGIYFQRLETSKAMVLIEDIVASKDASKDILLLYVKILVEERKFGVAASAYRELRAKFPAARDEQVEAKLRDYSGQSVSEESQGLLDEWVPGGAKSEVPVHVEKPKIKFDDVGGMAGVKEQISFKIIRPVQHKELFAAYGKKAGGGILLYGPPGCGKTYMARATAGETGSFFLSVGIHDVLSMWVGGSEHNLHSIFEFARRNPPSVLFFDEADALGASRTDMKAHAGRHTINQFLMEMDGDKYSNEGVMILAATNAPWHLDPAFLRPGRFDRVIFVPPPDVEARAAILKVLMRGKPSEAVDFGDLARKTDGFSGADLAGLVDVAVEDLLREVLRSNKELPLTTKNLSKALKSVKPTTRDWFATARNYAVYSNESGLYDDVAKYLRL